MIEGQSQAAANVILRAREEYERQGRERQMIAISAGGYASEAQRLQEAHQAAYKSALAEFNAEWARRGREVKAQIDSLNMQAHQAELAKMEQIRLDDARRAAEAKAAAIRATLVNAEAEAAKLGVSTEAYIAWRTSAS